jgi:hypothetical protein
MPKFNLADYETVEERIKRLMEEHPDARIVTKLIQEFNLDGPKTWVFKASVYLTAGDQAAGLPKATGYASEIDGTGGANNGSACENAETSSIGRCLKNMSMSGTKGASRQEMEKVNRIDATDWIAEANGLTEVKALRSLYTRARAQGAPAEVLEMVKARAESIGQQDS